MTGRIGHFFYHSNKYLLQRLTRPCFLESAQFEPSNALCYVLNEHSTSNLAILDLVCEQQHLPSPIDHFNSPYLEGEQRHFYLNHALGRLFRHNIKQDYPERMDKLLTAAMTAGSESIRLVPVSVFWSRAPDKEKSLLKLFLSERWSPTSRIRRLVGLLFNRKNITVHFGHPIELAQVIDPELDQGRLARRLARLLRSSFRKQRTAFLGHDRSHRRTLMKTIVESSAVTQAISIEAKKQNISKEKAHRLAHKYVRAIASDMTYVTIRFFDRILTWFWNRIYDGVEVRNLEKVREVGETSTLIYVPSHRSHVDYLLLPYVLYYHGLKLPHIAAGDNLNMPLVGSLLRRAGAFFMRRSFRSDQLYATVFKEYFYQILDRTYSVVFFPEGGRTRTGRLMPAKVGLINMVIENQHRGLRQPIAFIPINFGYEKLIEASSYLDELRGTHKKRESLADIFKSLRLIRQKFGQVTVSFGTPIQLDAFLKQHQHDSPARLPDELGRLILQRINGCAVVTPANLISLVTLCTPRCAIDEVLLAQQLACYQNLLAANDIPIAPELSPQECIQHAEQLGLVEREASSNGDIICHDPFAAVLMTWYRNNSLHTLAIPSLIACLVVNRRRKIKLASIQTMVTVVYPYIIRELQFALQRPVAAEVLYWLHRLVDNGLLRGDPETMDDGGFVEVPELTSSKFFQLDLLAKIMLQPLERFFIVIALLVQAGSGNLQRKILEEKCQQVAARMSRIYGLNAPEFFDHRLFHIFVDTLLTEGVLRLDNKFLTFEQLLPEVTHLAERVIPNEFRYAVLRERQ